MGGLGVGTSLANRDPGRSKSPDLGFYGRNLFFGQETPVGPPAALVRNAI